MRDASILASELELPRFSEGPDGLFRQPANIELLHVDSDGETVWLMLRRNEIGLRIPLSASNAEHLSRLLSQHADRVRCAGR